MAIGLLIIGDEILSGKRADLHLPRVIDILKARGLQLGWAHYLGDDPEQIIPKLRETMSSGDIVFSCGGIGATPDDHTRLCAAKALGVPLELHPLARKAIKMRIEQIAAERQHVVDMDAPENQNRLKMGEFPVGAEIIPNSFNNIPGFSVGTHYFVPGFPEMAWPMIAWALDTYHADLFHQELYAERAILVFNVMEALMTSLMEEIEAAHSGVKTYSLPRIRTETDRGYIEFGVKGNPKEVISAFERVIQWMRQHGAEFEYIEEDASR